MKKLIFILITFFCVIGVSAQEKYFTLTPNWLVSTTDSTKNYTVIYIDSTSADQLYNKTINYINLIYANPETVLKGRAKNEFLTFTTQDKIVLKFNVDVEVDLNYYTTIFYKDNKVKVSFNNISLGISNQGSVIPIPLVNNGWLSWSILNQQGIAESKNAEILETYFNNKIKELYVTLKFWNIQNEDW